MQFTSLISQRVLTACLLALSVWLAGAAGVAGAQTPAPVSPAPIGFERDILPILTVNGCNQGACHGKARGQNGFQLSLLGFDADFDHAALVGQARGRRIFPAAPEQSLVLLKASGRLPHGGGVRLEENGEDYQLLKAWIAQGAPRRVDGESALVRLELSPTTQFLQPGGEIALKVVAHFADGTQRDVTSRTQYQSSEAATVSASKTGVVKAGSLPGEATIMVRYRNVIEICHVAIPQEGTVPEAEYAQLPRNNFIDELVYAKLKTLGITPSAPCNDSTFLRRAHIDLIGRIPSPDEVRQFLADQNPTKRALVVDQLLQRPEYANHWSAKWADLLRPNPYHVGIKAVVNYDQWIREGFRQNKPYDQFVKELLTAQGSSWDNGAAVLFRDRRAPEEMTTLVSQLFLGIRLECAKCHHHPFEKWSQEDFFSFAAYFGRVGFKGQGISAPISGGVESIFTKPKGEVKHPLTLQVLAPRTLFGEAPALSDKTDPRQALAHWIASDQNPFFAQVMVNRVWADLMGRGIVEPVDDLRATNPPTNGPLLVALGKHFQETKFDIKKLLKTIVLSQIYALESNPTPRNVADRQNYSRHYRSRLRAEVLLDAMTDITGIPEVYTAVPEGARSNEMWTTRVDSIFLDTFGRPNENQDPPCERLTGATVTQTLHLMNAPTLHARLTADGGTAVKLATSALTPPELVEEIYLTIYGRMPDAEEREIGAGLFAPADANRRQAVEDLMWALVNTPEFVLKN